MDKSAFGEYIRKLRTERKLSLSGLAKMVDISPFYISYMENGKKTNPNVRIIGRMFEAMKLNKQEIEQFLDLHAKANGCVSYDIAEFIMRNDEIRKMIRCERDKDGNDLNWDSFISNLIKSGE